MNKSIYTFMTLAAVTLSCHAYAMEFGKPITASVILTNQDHYAAASYTKQSLPLKKTVTLMNIQLTRQQKQILRETQVADAEVTANANTPSGLPRQHDRGMNGTPVLDQGAHGTCVTFSNTAAIDALLGKGDYVSQLCNLELGSYFEEKGYLPSGWDGTSGPLVLNQIIGFGIIKKTEQNTISCGGLKDYPVTNPNEIGASMHLDAYKQFSENLNEKLDWQPMLTFAQRFTWNPESTASADNLLNAIKTAITTKQMGEDSRLTFGTLLPVEYCSAGACARYHAENDTWALTHAIKKNPDPTLAGHEMIITGYNDDAVVIDNEGSKHQGLLILRNSWGTDAGDKGNYYMTYDFFKKYVIEVQNITISKEQA